jgi:acetyltransferase
MSKSDQHFLDSFFKARSVAIVGATRNPAKLNHQLTENMVRLGYTGRLYPINPNSTEISGLPAFASVGHVPGEIDLVVISLPFPAVPGVVRECVEKGVKRIVIVSGGFSEAGAEGARMQGEILNLARQNGVRILGPNTLSPVNTENNLAISFHPCRETMRRGGLSFISQSGLYDYKLHWLLGRVGICKILDLGNKMDINEVDALEYLGEDADTGVIAMHMETIRGDGRRFMAALKNACGKKPVIILKSGRTTSGSQAAASHTGSLAQENDVVVDNLFRQAGAIRVQNLEELFGFAKAFEFLTPPNDNRTAIVSISGGEGVIATDACEQYGFRLAKFNQETLRQLKQISTPWEMPVNPFDLGVAMQFHTRNPAEAVAALCSIVYDEGVDCLVMQSPSVMLLGMAVTVSPSAVVSLMDQIVELFAMLKEKGKPVVLWRSTMDSMEDEFVRKLELRRVPVFATSQEAMKVLGALLTYHKQRSE